MDTLHRLWRLAENEAQRLDTTAESVFGDLGLFLQRPLVNYGYSSTPANSSTFASTGGDGVHYGLLHINGEVREDSPVVMTVPMMFEEGNLILGDNLQEFLALGCQVGYFNLEQFVYDKALTIHRLDNAEAIIPESTTVKDQLLLNLTREFSLSPWPEYCYRLETLHNKWSTFIEFPLSSS